MASASKTPSSRWAWFHRFGSPAYFYHFATRWGKWCGIITALLFVIGLYLGLVVAPPDYQMGDSYRIIFIHVPSAWMSMSTYAFMAICAGIGLVWHMKLADIVAQACAPIGAAFTFCALVTGSLWGKPTWGTYWESDARMMSELVLLFLYFGYIALVNAIEDKKTASKAGAVLALVGVVNLPIIHYSVEWWNTLHQGSTVTKLGRPSMSTSMLIPLLIMFVAFNFYFVTTLFSRIRLLLLDQERRTKWAQEVIHG